MNILLVLFFLFLDLYSFQHVLTEMVVTNNTSNKVLIKNGFSLKDKIIGDNDFMFFSAFKFDSTQDVYKTDLRIESGHGLFSRISLFSISISRDIIEKKIENMHHTGNYLQISLQLNKKKGLCKFLPNCYILKSNDLGVIVR